MRCESSNGRLGLVTAAATLTADRCCEQEPCVREMLDCASSAGLPTAERAQLIELQRTCSAQTPAVLQVPAPSPPPQQLEVTCAREISALQVGTRARTKFERDFKEGIGAAAGVPPARVVVDSIRGGSVVVSCHIGAAAGAGGGGVSAAGAVAALQRAFAAGSVRVAGRRCRRRRWRCRRPTPSSLGHPRRFVPPSTLCCRPHDAILRLT